MELKEAIEKRKSVRYYEDKPIPEDKLLRVLEVVRWLHQAVIVSHGSLSWWEAARDNRNYGYCGGSHQPQMVMICEVPEYGVDLAISADYMTVAAVDEGFGTCWIGAFSQDEAREQFG